MSEKVRDYPKLAKDILQAIGGEENVVSVSRCATRLRIVLKHSKPNAKDVVTSLPGVITAVEKGGQFQVVIGQHVGEVYDEFSRFIDIDEPKEYNDDENKPSILNRIIATMSAVFAPFIYVLAAAGILQGLLIVINLFVDGFTETGTYQVFSFISWAPFVFLPIFIAITASKHFKTNMFIAVAASAALVSPDWADLAAQIADGTTITFLGLPLSETVYTSSVLPPLFLVWILSYLERFLNKIMNDVIKPLFVPFFSLVIMVPLTILIIGPITTMGANGIANGYNFLADTIPILAGALIGGLWQILVIFGVHWGTTPMVLANFDQFGRDSFQAYQTIAVIAQVGAVIGVIIKAKSQEVRKVGTSAGITGLFGITEPAIYGVTLRFKKPFIIGSISGAVGAMVASFFNPYYFAYAGLPGPLTIVNAIDAEYPLAIWGVLLGSIIAIVLPIILIQIFGYGEDSAQQAGGPSLTDDEKPTADDTQPGTENDERITSPLDGKVIPLSEVNDDVFGSGAMGKGVAIRPSGNKIYAPFDGEIVMLAPTKHAIGLKSTSGVELLIHIGIDTVELNGEPFTTHIEDGAHFSKGDLLIEFDKEFIQDKGVQTTTPIIVTNSNDYNEIIIKDIQESKVDEPLLVIIK